MIENYRSGLVWRTMRRNAAHRARADAAPGFTGGWLDAAADALMQRRRRIAPGAGVAAACLCARLVMRAGRARRGDAALLGDGPRGRGGRGAGARFRAREPRRQRRACSRSRGRRRTRSCSPRSWASSSPDVAQLGNTWIAEFTALRGARAARARGSRARPGVARQRLLRRHLGRPTSIDGAGLRHAVVRGHARAVLPHATSFAARGLRPRCRSDWDAWRQALTAVQRRRRARALRACSCPPNECELLPMILGLQAGSPLPRRPTGRAARSTASAFRRAFDFYARPVPRTLRAVRSPNRDIANLYQEFARGYVRRLHHGAVEPGRVPAPLADPSCQDAWSDRAAAGPGRRGLAASVGWRADRASSSEPPLATQGGGVEADPSSCRAANQQVRFYRAVRGDLPARREAWRGLGAHRRSRGIQARSSAQLPAGTRRGRCRAGVGADRDPTAVSRPSSVIRGRAPRRIRCSRRVGP